jgi:hypothetical protein
MTRIKETRNTLTAASAQLRNPCLLSQLDGSTRLTYMLQPAAERAWRSEKKQGMRLELCALCGWLACVDDGGFGQPVGGASRVVLDHSNRNSTAFENLAAGAAVYTAL